MELPFDSHEHEMHIRVGACTLRCTRLPSGSKPEAVLAHGFGQTRGAWRAAARAFATQGIGSLAFDARGHGDSDRNPADRPYRGEDFVEDMIAVAAHAGPGPVLVGASMGGLVGLLAQAKARPFSALVLVDVTPKWEDAGFRRILGFMQAHPDGFADLGQAADAIAAYLPHRPRKTPAQLREILRQSDDGRWRWHWDPRLIDEFAVGVEAHQAAMAEAARALDVPTLLVSGGRSDLVSDRTVDDFLALAPHARHVRLPGATHMVAGDDNRAFAGAVLDFLSSLDSTQPQRALTGAVP
ncbi:alpha/beta fold hydrolase [Coralloluteibacterium thermophilus]|uniref:Alpha/beta fold hydrolase n=1 Tax=Coralloluteibacterium thermophilum TaxID=2707049 RepID=A0ABV9NIZ1_9GAMM